MARQRLIIWTIGIDELFVPQGFVGGIKIQMHEWAKQFIQNGWEVYSLTRNKAQHNVSINEINFIYMPHFKLGNILFEFFYSCYFIIKYRPQIILIRGAIRNLFSTAIFSKLINGKLIVMFASDSDLSLGSELISRIWDKMLYREGIRLSHYFVVQNSTQKFLLEKNYKKYQSLTIPNIWSTKSLNFEDKKRNKVIWVSNIRKLKRPEWFLKLASDTPEENFVMVGSAIDLELYQNCEERAKLIPNLDFCGGASLSEVDNIFAGAKILICTSTIEGFPNTFLQAWSHKIPVISTFDPSGIIETQGLGIIINRFEELSLALSSLNDDVSYLRIQENIDKYFTKNHDPNIHFKNLINFLG